MSPDVGRSIGNRLRSVEGHLKAITSMVENGATCKQVLHQIKAVKGSLNAITRMLIDTHLKECERVLRQSACLQERNQALEDLILFLRWTIESKQLDSDLPLVDETT